MKMQRQLSKFKLSSSRLSKHIHPLLVILLPSHLLLWSVQPVTRTVAR